MKKRLAIVRTPLGTAEEIARNESVRREFDVLYLTVSEPSQSGYPFWKSAVHENPTPDDDFVEELFRDSQITHVLVCQPLQWYSERVRDACDRLGIKLVWMEGFPGGYDVFDTIGCPYRRDNEIVRYEERVRRFDPVIPYPIRFSLLQPDVRPPSELYRKYGGPESAIVLFGQVEGDMSLVDRTGRMRYGHWMQEIVLRNPDVTFLVKDHPFVRREGKISPAIARLLENSTNTRLFDESIHAAFRSYWAFAAYSSTTILDGAYRNLPFITGGYHSLDDPKFCYRVVEPDKFDGILDAYEGFRSDGEALHRRLGFLTGIYTMKTSDPRIVDKVLLSADEFYGRHGGL